MCILYPAADEPTSRLPLTAGPAGLDLARSWPSSARPRSGEARVRRARLGHPALRLLPVLLAAQRGRVQQRVACCPPLRCPCRRRSRCRTPLRRRCRQRRYRQRRCRQRRSPPGSPRRPSSGRPAEATEARRLAGARFQPARVIERQLGLGLVVLLDRRHRVQRDVEVVLWSSCIACRADTGTVQPAAAWAASPGLRARERGEGRVAGPCRVRPQAAEASSSSARAARQALPTRVEHGVIDRSARRRPWALCTASPPPVAPLDPALL